MNQEQVKQMLSKNFTLKGRMFYPNLLEPKANQAGRMQYSVMFAWGFNENTQVTQELGQFIANFKQQLFSTIPDQFFVNPVKKYGSYQRQDGKPVAEFLKDHYWINASSGADFPPVLVDQSRQPVMNPSDVYSGRNCVINLSFYKIDKEKKGLGTNVRAIMLQEGGEPVGGTGSVNVDDVFGQFTTDMNTSGVAPQQGQAWPPQNNGTNNNNNGGGFV